MLKIDLDREDVTKILREKYGDASFRVFYTESDNSWEVRNDTKIFLQMEAPKKEEYVLYFD